ncbi:MAG: hypothetical protein ACK55I_44640, partial [bacterium]
MPEVSEKETRGLRPARSGFFGSDGSAAPTDRKLDLRPLDPVADVGPVVVEGARIAADLPLRVLLQPLAQHAEALLDDAGAVRAVHADRKHGQLGPVGDDDAAVAAGRSELRGAVEEAHRP